MGADNQAQKVLDRIERLKAAEREIERLTAENHFLFDVIKDDPLLVERYNAFNERRLLEAARTL